MTRIFFIGDTHGDSECAREWVRRTGLIDFDSVPWRWTGHNASDALVFLGDYVDRGFHSLEVVAYMLALKCMCPQKMFLLRGNHEMRSVNGAWVGGNDGVFYQGTDGGIFVWTRVLIRIRTRTFTAKQQAAGIVARSLAGQ